MNVADEMWMAGVVAEERARLDGYAKAWQAYFGNYPKPLKVDPKRPDDNVIVNYVRFVVNSSVAMLFGKEPVFDLDPNSTERSPAEEWLDECWRVNRKMLLLKKVAINGGVCGHVFIKIQQPRPGEQYPRLINLSPEYVNVVTDPDDIDFVWRYIIQYPARGINGERLVKKQTVERDEAGRWTVKDELSVNDGGWRVVSETVWPWLWAPIIDSQNLPSPNETYGLADAESDVIALNKAVNFTLSNMQRILRFHAHPKTWGSGIVKGELRVDVDEAIGLSNPQAQLHNLEMQSDLSSSIEFFKRLDEAIHVETRTPPVAAGKLESIGNLSGVALQILYGPQIQLTEDKRTTYGEMLVELNRRLWEMGGHGDQNICTVRWPDVLPKNRMEELQAALLAEQLGVSQDTLLTEAGYDPDEERAKREANTENMADAMLTAFDRGQGAPVSSNGNGVGAVDNAQ